MQGVNLHARKIFSETIFQKSKNLHAYDRVKSLAQRVKETVLMLTLPLNQGRRKIIKVREARD